LKPQNELDKITITIYFRKYFIALVPKAMHLEGNLFSRNFVAKEIVDFLEVVSKLLSLRERAKFSLARRRFKIAAGVAKATSRTILSRQHSERKLQPFAAEIEF